MTTAQLITELQKFPGDSIPLVMPLDYNPHPQVLVASVVNQDNGTEPLLLIFLGPGLTLTYNASGFGNIKNA